MKLRRYTLFLLLALSLACSSVSQVFAPTPTATSLPPTPTLTPTITPTPTATPFPTAAFTPPECVGLPIATIPAATTLAEPAPSLGSNPYLSTEEQLQLFDVVVKKINEVYLYPDFNGVDWPAIVKTYRAKIADGLETNDFYDEMGKLFDELKDEHSQFLSPVMVAQMELSFAGNNDFVGVGVLITTMLEKDRLAVLAVFPDSAADHANIKPHDSLLAVDGLPLVENKKSYSYRLRGPSCSVVRVTVQSPGESPRDVVLVRSRIVSSLPIDAKLVTTTDGSRIGYIFIPSFMDETIPAQIGRALEDFGTLDGLILDNRMNTGGASTVVEPILRYFTSGKLGEFVSRDEKRLFEVEASGINNSQTVPLVVLVGEGSASFGEIFAGILQDLGRAKVIGQTTPGNVETLHGYMYGDGSVIWIAAERFDPFNSDTNWELDGIVPDVEAYADWDTFTFETDPAIIAAVKLFGHK